MTEIPRLFPSFFYDFPANDDGLKSWEKEKAKPPENPPEDYYDELENHEHDCPQCGRITECYDIQCVLPGNWICSYCEEEE